MTTPASKIGEGGSLRATGKLIPRGAGGSAYLKLDQKGWSELVLDVLKLATRPDFTALERRISNALANGLGPLDAADLDHLNTLSRKDIMPPTAASFNVD